MSLLKRSNGRYASVSTRRPLARTDDLVVEELDGELLIYDGKTKRAHCVSATAARVWRACDGSANAESLAQSLGLDAGQVREAFDELERAELFDAGLQVHIANGNGNGNGHSITRRQLTKRSAQVGAAAVAAPMILSISAPTAMAALTVIPFTCELYTVQSCGTSDACGHIDGCCCCCQGGGACKTCGATAFCNSTNPATQQPCNPLQGGGVGSHCSTVGSRPASPQGCCGVSGAKQCGCGFGPDAGCCDPSAAVPGSACAPGSTSTCVPCCNNTPLVSSAALGCCKSSTVNCCAPGAPACCMKSSQTVDCCTNPTTACCLTSAGCGP